LDLNFRDFHLLDVIANMLLKSSTFIRSLNMHLYWSNINLKIDILYSLPLPYIWLLKVKKVESSIILTMLINSSFGILVPLQM